jgi:hypothetical protein
MDVKSVFLNGDL